MKRLSKDMESTIIGLVETCIGDIEESLVDVMQASFEGGALIPTKVLNKVSSRELADVAWENRRIQDYFKWLLIGILDTAYDVEFAAADDNYEDE